MPPTTRSQSTDSTDAQSQTNSNLQKPSSTNLKTQEIVNSAQLDMTTPFEFQIATKLLNTYNGNKDDLDQFLENCDTAMEIVKDDHKSLLFKIILSKLIDNACKKTKSRQFKDWSELKAYLIEIFSDQRTTSQWQTELNSCKQGFREDVSTFASRVENCCIKLIQTLDKNLADATRKAYKELFKANALDVFIRGLNRDLSILIKCQKPATLEAAISLALSEERELKSKIPDNFNVLKTGSTKFCNYCKKPGHPISECRTREANNSRNFSNNNPGYNNRFQRNDNNNVRRTQGQPNNDYRYSPPRNNYPRNNSNPNSNNSDHKTCSYCKRDGHLIETCWKLQNNNSRPKYQNSNRNGPPNNNNQSNDSLNSQQPPRSPVLQRGALQVQAELDN